MRLLPLQQRRAIAVRPAPFLQADRSPSWLFPAVLALVLAGCGEKKPPAPQAETEVTAFTVVKKDAPVSFEFVAQTQSSHEVQIRARVAGFLEKRVYREGERVRAGQVLFVMDKKPFEASLQSAKGVLEQQRARLVVAEQNLARVRPLAADNAVSKKDLDDAIGAERSARAALLAAEGEVRTAQLNLSYTTILSPVDGLSGYARKEEGSYVTPGESGFLTYVSQVDPMWINFSVSENELLKWRADIDAGRLRFPKNGEFDVQVVLADGSVFPNRGHINFISPTFSKETGTFLVRTEVANPSAQLRPGQFVRARVNGALRPDAILVPQRAVLQGNKSNYVWVIDKEGKAHERSVEVGEWQGDDWFILRGIDPGERIVVDGAVRVAADRPVKIVEKPVAANGAPASATGVASASGNGAEQAGRPAANKATQ
ncbi:efflux RND transporter periplasmic adaptor subunit [Noviherbaspirillum pedocola]|uniref:Efflux RND transporter periplasmic adaptor subunit n=1 Tax=Noviherbaspirillum pedocola TaxID=2801341 RepID=A0A934T2N4_9BURK|nr:efflux RND transporter periplasmic adaptor subunit [Noviherbaspirillum pedocola]MBK4738467.1 efflux RND transporter periplasmic adaptor subunit [Noviherbaspirillum pedocola]